MQSTNNGLTRPNIFRRIGNYFLNHFEVTLIVLAAIIAGGFFTLGYLIAIYHG